MKKLMLLSVVGIVAIAAGTANATLATWDHSWEADFLPHNDPTLVWTRYATAPFSENNNGNSGVSTISGGNGNNNGVQYYLSNGSGDGTGKMNWSAGGSIEWKLKPHTSGNISFMHIADGTYEYTVGMYPGYWAYKNTDVSDYVWSSGHTVGTDIYRLDLTAGGNSADLYLNDVHQVNIPGAATVGWGVEEKIYWGTDLEWASGGNADWDYIRWNVNDPNLDLVVAPSVRNVEVLAGSTTFDVSNNGTETGMTWDAAETETWFSLTGGSGTDAGTFTVNYDENIGAERTGNITVTAAEANGSPRVVMVTQSAAPVCGDSGFPPHDTTGPDGVPDCIVDFYDFRDFAFHWLTCTPPVVCP